MRTLPNTNRVVPQKQGVARPLRSPEESCAAAQATVKRLEAALCPSEESDVEARQVLQSSFQKARSAAQVLPLKNRDCGERRQQAISWKTQMETELEEGRARLRHLQEETEMDVPPVPPDFGAELAALKAQLVAVEEERDSLRSTACKRQATTPSRPECSRQVPMMPQLIPAELELWRVDRQSELKEAISLGECCKVLELTSMLSDAAVRIMEMSGRMVP